MALPRWKLTTGLLGLSLGGLVATADPPCPGKTTATGSGCGVPPGVVVVAPPIPAAPTISTAIQVALQPPVDVPPPQLSDGKRADTPSLPEFQLVKVEPPKVAEAPKIDAPAIELPKPLVAADPPKVDLPKIDQPKIELPAAEPTKAGLGPLGAKPVDSPYPLPAPVISDDAPKVVPPPVKEIPAINLPVAKAEPAPPTPDPLPVAKAEPTPAPVAVAEPAVKVTIHLGDGSPRFDVLTGDDTLLKVVCDGLDVKTPGDKGRTMSALKATKNVRFTATWCEGTCHELSVIADTGEVVLTGDVRVRTKKGKGETQIIASQMTFKLGTAPAFTVAEPGTTGVQTTSFKK